VTTHPNPAPAPRPRATGDLAIDGVDALAIADTVREPLLVLDECLHVRYANRAFTRQFGAGAEATVGQSLWTLGGGQWNHPELRRLLKDVLPKHARFDDFELEHHFGALGTRVLWLNASEIEVAGSTHRYVLLAMEDVTQRRRAEQEVAERTREVERFTMVASHDLQEPLRKIQTYGAMLRDECGPTLGDECRDYVERMSSAATRMQTLIQDLLALARTSTVAPRAMRLELGRVVRDVLIDLEVAIQESGASVTIGALPAVVADPLQMRQLFQNLLSNALKFRRPDVPLHVAIEERARDRAAAVHEIVVRDNGIGFEDRHAETIFGPFQRLHARHEFAGNGIGLAICRRIVERHQGSIVARSAAGEGTTFTIRLPVAGPVQRTPAASQTAIRP
jgi:PAS domain S-box-containing protein